MTGSNNCKNRHDNLLKKELQRQSKASNQNRDTDPEGTTIELGTQEGTDNEKVISLGSDKCKNANNPHCNFIENEVTDSACFLD